MDLPKKQDIFDFDYTSFESGKRYEGAFTVLCSLNIEQRHALELEKTRLMGGHLNPSDGLSGLATILSKLRTHMIDGPPWWTQSMGGSKIEDEDTIVALYDKILEAEDKWKESLRTKGEEAKKENEKEAEKTETLPQE